MNHITTMSEHGLRWMTSLEALKLKAYKDTSGVWTIGVGTIRYPDGTRVQEGDTITEELALTYKAHDVEDTEHDIDAMTRDDLTQTEFDALVSFGYNVGTKAPFGNSYKGSRLAALVNMHGTDPVAIEHEFALWCHGPGGVVVAGLVHRRAAEATLFLKGRYVDNAGFPVA